MYADFEGGNEVNNSSKGDKTTTYYKQNPVCNGFHIVSELDDVLKSFFYKSHLGYDNVEWLVDEVIKIENKMTFFWKTPTKIF